MNSTTNWISFLRSVSSLLLLLFLIIQIIIVLLLAADVDDFEIDEIHEVCGFIFLGLMVIHILVYWKSLKSLLKFKKSNYFRMKRTNILLTLLFVIFITGCDKDECHVCHECECICANPSAQANDISATLKSGTWFISYFFEDGEPETSDFSGNSFTYSDSGIIAVSIRDSVTDITGNWKLMTKNGQSELYLDFMQPGKFLDLNDDWEVIEYTKKLIRLEELCDDDTGVIDYLTFSNTR
jgi:hypothetical protein